MENQVNLKYIGFDELQPGHNYPKLADSMESGPYPHKEEIIRYLLNSEVFFISLTLPRDVFTGKRIPMSVRVMQDGDYYWSTLLAWYVDKYNVRLPKEFEEHILRKK